MLMNQTLLSTKNTICFNAEMAAYKIINQHAEGQSVISMSCDIDAAAVKMNGKRNQNRRALVK